jgi:hypothetical protein
MQVGTGRLGPNPTDHDFARIAMDVQTLSGGIDTAWDYLDAI